MALRGAGVEFDTAKMKIRQTEASVQCREPQKPTPCDPYNSPCLFDLSQDPCEFNNLAFEFPDILNRLISNIKELNATALEPIRRYSYPEAAPQYWNNTWTNWKDHLDPEP